MKIKGGSFSSMGLNKKLFYNIPYVHPTPIQRKALPLVLEGTDVMCISQTGSGKSLVYILPAIQRAIEGKRTFLIAPTRELCIQIHKMFKKLLIGINVNLYALTGHSDDKKHCKSNIVISTVGKLKYCLTELKEIVDVDLLVIDEVDRILEEGGMRSDLIDILKWIRKERQTVLVSATLPDECVVVDNEEDALFNENICSNNFFSGNKKSNLDENQDFSKTDKTSNLIMEVESKNNDEKENKKVEKISELEKKTKHIDKYQKNFEVDIFKKLKYTQSVIFSDIFLQPLIENPVLVKIDVIVSELVKNYFFYLPDVCKEAAVVFLLKKITDKKTVIFVSTKHTADLLSAIFEGLSLKYVSIYSSMDIEARKINMNKFVSENVNILIATDLGGRGLNIRNLDVVINYDMTDSKNFVHRVGRVGRNGREGSTFNLVSPEDLCFFTEVKNKLYDTECEIGKIPQKKLDEISEKINDLEINHLRRIAIRGNKKAKLFRKKIKVEKENLDIKLHSVFENKTQDSLFNTSEISEVKREILNESNVIDFEKILDTHLNRNHSNTFKTELDTEKYRDQFFIPYGPNNEKKCTYSSYDIIHRKLNKKRRKN